ncbi:MAG: hemerythrin domain-containing protein [Sandaracinaceae bacterium]
MSEDTTSHTGEVGGSLRGVLMEDHARLERSLRALLDAGEGALPNELIAVWNEFETGLRTHFQTEEESLFPLVTDEALRASLMDDHAMLRERLDELGVAIELHSARLERITELVNLLRAHAAREDTTLYGLADERASGGVRREVLRRLDRLRRELR